MFWSKKPTSAVHDRSRVVGLDLTSSRARAVSVGAGRPRTLALDGADEDLRLFANLDRRTPEIGRVGYALARRLPHAVGTNFLPALGLNRSWPTARGSLSAEAAIGLTFAALHPAVTHDSDALGLALPSYLTAAQVKRAAEAATGAKLPLRGTVSAPLAVVAHRADAVLGTHNSSGTAPAEADGGRPDWVVPLRQQDTGPGTVVVVDADEFALSAAIVAVDPGEVRLLASALWPRQSAKVWKDRVLDAVSDRCVRLCRRDPRDSAEAEQFLFEQLDDALDRTQHGQSVALTVRSAHWYQDVPQRAEDFEGYCAQLTRQSTDGLRELVASANLPMPPRVVWLTHAAARLPGLADGVYKASAEQTRVAVLPPNTVAEATAALVPRWLAGELPKSHLDTSIPRATATIRDTRPNAWLPARPPHVKAGG